MVANVLNKIFNLVIDSILYPFKELEAIWGVLFISVITGILMLLIFKRFSDQQRIKTAKEKIKAHLMELIIYKDDIKLTFIALKDIFVNHFKYLALMIKPMVFLIIPVMFILIQLASRYEYRPLYVGDSAIVTVKHSEYTSNEKVVLNTTLAIEIETPALNIADYREINWRIKAIKEGEWNLTFQYGDQVETKKIIIGTKLTQIPNHRFKSGFFDILLNPADPFIHQDSFLEEIEIIYPERRLYIGGWHVHWLTLFILVSFISGFLFKNIFKVEI